MIAHNDLEDALLRKRIRQQQLVLGGNRRLKIYGSLTCTSGKRMKKENHVFFASEDEAWKLGYRPCGHCK
jgi:methylphosphotriester-DNA--protein-cysteine methyltransferase